MPGRLRRKISRIFSRESGRKISLRVFWSDIREAIAGSDKDFTSIKLGRAIFLLALPMVLELAMESVFAVVDIFFVSKLGADAVATVGITESLMTIVYSLAMGLATATTALVSRRIGEKNPSGASTAAVQAILIGVALSLLISLPGILYAKDILRLMGASPDLIRSYSGYTTVMLGANAVIFLLFIINAVFRSSGDAAVSMRVLWLANGINIFLDPCLIFGWDPFPVSGVMGAAVATNIGRGIAILYQFNLLFRGNKRVRLKMSSWKIDFKVIRTLIRLSLGGIGQSLIATTSWIGLVRIVSMFGSAVVAGYTIAIRIVLFSLLPAWGLSNAASTLVGQNLGAGKPDRAESSAWRTGFINMGFMGFVGLSIIVFPEFLMRFFIRDQVVVASGSACLRLLGYGYLSYGLGMAIVNSFNGAGDTATPTYINFFCFWLLEIPLAYVLALPLGLEEKGVYVAILAAETMMTVAAVLLFRRGKWKLRQV
ncbi:MAG: MATE family efflux transporter [Candidatus Aminicenantes bacterium]|nr:MATE family efflux transporter [Candidatus Aminicenantes bacterium]